MFFDLTKVFAKFSDLQTGIVAKLKVNAPSVEEKEELQEVKTEEVQTDWRVEQAIKDIKKGRELSASLNRGTSGLMLYYEIKSMKDGAVCEHCKEFHGEKFLFETAIVGVNYPPFNCCKSDRCRCAALSKMIKK